VATSPAISNRQTAAITNRLGHFEREDIGVFSVGVEFIYSSKALQRIDRGKGDRRAIVYKAGAMFK
jgi:hypothetical protein